MSRTTLRFGASGGIPNGSLSPCTISTGTVDLLELRQARLLRPARRVQREREAEHAGAPIAAAVRQATRAPDERPPT